MHHLMQAYQAHQDGTPWADTEFVQKVRTVVANRKKRYGDFDYDVEADMARYKVRIALNKLFYCAAGIRATPRANGQGFHCASSPRHCLQAIGPD
jgi:hypothetical protein